MKQLLTLLVITLLAALVAVLGVFAYVLSTNGTIDLGGGRYISGGQIIQPSTGNGYVIQSGAATAQPYQQYNPIENNGTVSDETVQQMLTNIADHGSSGPASSSGGAAGSTDHLLATPSANNGAAGSGPAHSRLP